MTDRYAVIGNPVAHSKSPAIHSKFAELTGEAIRYDAVLSPLDEFASVVAKFAGSGGKGANVTLPFKEEAFALASELTERARSARAVNTLTFRGSAIAGDNTDGCGLVRDLKSNLEFTIRARRVLLLGAGGAARGVLLPLVTEQPSAIVIANRTIAKARDLATSLQHAGTDSAVSACGYDDLAGEAFDLVINATSTGLTDTPLALPKGLYRPGALAYDLVYGRATAFMRQARGDGAASTSDGLGMLVEQAAESFFLWRGVRPPTRAIVSSLRAA
jgi:shikimate dehydrogenase